MQPSLTPQEFVDKWRTATLKERSAAQEHFIDLCRLVGHGTPAEMDPQGEWFTFEAGAGKQSGGQGWADVWKRGFFAWEYKGKHADLDRAYQQLLQYREALQNPPLLVVSDIDQIQIHTNFTNTIKRVYQIGLDDLLTPEGQKQLQAVFFEPAGFRAPQTTEQVTEEAAREFARLADLLRRWGEDPQDKARFLIRLLFPWPPSQEPAGDPRVEAIARAARELVEKRDAWLNPPGASQPALKKRTLTNLYNQRPTWLDLAHRRLDGAVLDAYGWPHDLGEEAILERLLGLNSERAGVGGQRME